MARVYYRCFQPWHTIYRGVFKAGFGSRLFCGERANTLPILDISPLMPGTGTPDAEAVSDCIRFFDRVCQDPGFFYLVGHGIPQDDVDNLHRLSKAFFALPQDEKDKIALARRPLLGRGYQRLGENVTMGKSDIHEAIDFYAEPKSSDIDFSRFLQPPASTSLNDVSKMKKFALGPNQWPENPGELRVVAERHFQNIANVGRALMRALAGAFHLPLGYFDSLVDKSFWCARIIGYPHIGNDVLNSNNDCMSCGEHTDYGFWTILAMDSTRGALQVQTRGGEWMSVDPMPGAFVVNLGDMLRVCTQRRFSATPHRVMHKTTSQYRTSVAYFFEPNFDAVVNPLCKVSGDQHYELEPNLESTTEPLRRALAGGGLVYGEHVFAKFADNFKFT